MGFASATTKVFSANFLAVPTLPKFSSAKVLCYTVGYFKLCQGILKDDTFFIDKLNGKISVASIMVAIW